MFGQNVVWQKWFMTTWTLSSSLLSWLTTILSKVTNASLRFMTLMMIHRWKTYLYRTILEALSSICMKLSQLATKLCIEILETTLRSKSVAALSWLLRRWRHRLTQRSWSWLPKLNFQTNLASISSLYTDGMVLNSMFQFINQRSRKYLMTASLNGIRFSSVALIYAKMMLRERSKSNSIDRTLTETISV